MQYLYALELSDFEDTKEHYKNLINNIDSSCSLFLFQISLFIEIFKKAKRTYNISKEIISENINDKYSNNRFSENQFLNLISSDSKLLSQIKSNKFINWEVDYKFINLIYNNVVDSEIYSKYIISNNISFDEDVKFVQDIFKDIIVSDLKYQSFVEEKNIGWIDDFPHVNTYILKILKNLNEKNFKKLIFIDVFSNNGDKKYFDDLANLSTKNFESNNKLMVEYVANWDLERLAKIDHVIINLAITELVFFKDIPSKVTLNEYIEISKDYSTKKSSIFINGILDKLVKDLVENNTIIKAGRGLRE
tara:strand:- start:1602 stop:2516 length:915 start_codon:yes stop_codon:yes gene_type:complete